MGQLEYASGKRAKKKNLQKYILTAVAAAGVISIALLAPNVLGAFAKMGILPRPRQKEFIRDSRNRLIKKGLLEYKNKTLRLTEKGERVLHRLEAGDFRMKTPKRWDGKWRMLVFDIPEIKKYLRERVRLTLVAIGFMRLQNSVWIYPYDCEDLIMFLKADFKVGKDVLYVIVDSLEYDKHALEHFQLSR